MTIPGEISEIPFKLGPCPCWMYDCLEWLAKGKGDEQTVRRVRGHD